MKEKPKPITPTFTQKALELTVIEKAIIVRDAQKEAKGNFVLKVFGR